MNQDKNIQAHFYTRCGDVNGDLQVSPADAQRVFEIFLGLIPEATIAQLENSDVNCDGTPENPKVTPSNELPGDCSCKSRAATSQNETFKQINNSSYGTDAIIKINDVILVPGEEIIVPVIIKGPFNFKSFGFDLAFPTDILEFIWAEPTPFSHKFAQIQANIIADGVLRTGGYRKDPISAYLEETLIKLVFKVHKKTGSSSSLSVINKFDDFEHLPFLEGRITWKGNEAENSM